MSKAPKKTLFVDVGGTHTRFWSDSAKTKTIPTHLPSLPGHIKTHVSKTPIGEIRLGIRGVWTDFEKNSWARKLKPLAKRVVVLSDIEFHFEKVFKSGAGILLNAGTGSIALGRDENGRWSRAGGLGPLIGDEGSAFWMGKEYLKRTMTDDMKIRAWVVQEDPIPKIAALSKKVLSSKTPECRQIRGEAAEALAHLVWTVGRNLGKKPKINYLPIAFTGGLFANQSFKKQVEWIIRKLGFPVS